MLPSRPLGTTGLRAPVLGLGAGPLGDPALSDEAALDVLRLAVDLGVGLVDTAPSYGRSELRLGRLVREGRAPVVSTKLGYGVDGVEDWTGEAVRRGVDLALTRLGVEVLDIAHLHSCPRDVLEHSDVVEALLRAVEQGKVRVPAYSGEGDALRHAVRSGSFGVVQASVSCCDPVSGRTILREAVARGLGVLAKRPLANAPWRQAGGPYDERWERLGIEVGVEPDELMLRWTAYHPAVHVTLAGTHDPAHLARNATSVARGPLPRDVQAVVDTAIARADDGWEGVI